MTQKAERPSIYYLIQEGVIECKVSRRRGKMSDVHITTPVHLHIIHFNDKEGHLYLSYSDGWNKTKITSNILPKSAFEE